MTIKFDIRLTLMDTRKVFHEKFIRYFMKINGQNDAKGCIKFK